MSQRQSRHDTVSNVAQSHGALRSKFANGVSMHYMPKNVSFFHLRSIMNAAKSEERRMFVGVVNDELVVSVNFNYESSSASTSIKKRKRDTMEDDVDRALARLKSLSSVEVENARRVVLSLLQLRGERGEKAIESWAVSTQEKDDQNLPRLVLSARTTPGVPVALCLLKSALGPSFHDGLVTLKNATEFATGDELPQSADSKLAESLGARSFCIFATIVANTP
tara:strand:+ start:926 stop:1594 length:669 start_codon:yes stop_codon:yes gene_type:complete